MLCEASAAYRSFCLSTRRSCSDEAGDVAGMLNVDSHAGGVNAVHNRDWNLNNVQLRTGAMCKRRTCNDEASYGARILHHDGHAGGIDAAPDVLHKGQPRLLRTLPHRPYRHEQRGALQHQRHPQNCKKSSKSGSVEARSEVQCHRCAPSRTKRIAISSDAPSSSSENPQHCSVHGRHPFN